MVKLFKFNPGTLILSSEVNANFAALAEVLGNRSTSNVFAPPGQISLGERHAASLSALTDRVNSNNGYIHVGWNAYETYDRTGKVVLNRVGGVNTGATAVRIGNKGFRVLGTASKSNDLNKPTNFTTQFAIENDDRVYIKPSLSFVTKDVDTDRLSLDDYRLTLVPLENPYVLEDGTGQLPERGANTWSLSKSFDLSKLSFGIKDYHGVELYVVAKREIASGPAPIVRVYGRNMNVKTGVLLYINDVGITSVKGHAFFVRGENGNEILQVGVTHALKDLQIWVTGAWK